MSNQSKARALAARIGAHVSIGGEEATEIVVDAPPGHTWVAVQESHQIAHKIDADEAGAWRLTLEDLKAGLEPCPPDCECGHGTITPGATAAPGTVNGQRQKEDTTMAKRKVTPEPEQAQALEAYRVEPEPMPVEQAPAEPEPTKRRKAKAAPVATPEPEPVATGDGAREEKEHDHERDQV